MAAAAAAATSFLAAPPWGNSRSRRELVTQASRVPSRRGGLRWGSTQRSPRKVQVSALTAPSMPVEDAKVMLERDGYKFLGARPTPLTLRSSNPSPLTLNP